MRNDSNPSRRKFTWGLVPAAALLALAAVGGACRPTSISAVDDDDRRGPAFDCNAAAAKSELTIPPAGEPGTPMVVTGQVFAPDGKSPVPGALIFLYHTDADGYYEHDGHLTHPRLHGCLKTDAEGRFTFHTIKPGHYPGMHIPSHIHFLIRAAGYPEMEEGLQFLGDPYLTPEKTAEDTQDGSFSHIRPLEADGSGTLHCHRDFRLKR